MSQLKCIPGGQLSYLASAIAVFISKGFDNDDINILSSLFSAIGDSLGIIAAQQAACSSAGDTASDQISH